MTVGSEDYGRARIDNFVDAAFAFAVSLLVISVGDAPASLAELRTALLNTPAFAGGFALIALFWWAHHSWARLGPRRDGLSLFLSLSIVFVILVYVFPLRVLMLSGLGFMSGGLLPGGELIGSSGDLRLLYVIYGLGFSALGLLYALLYSHAARTLAADGSPERAVQAGQAAGSYLILLAAGLASTVLALVLPFGRGSQWAFSLPGFTYALIGPAMGLYYGWWVKRRGPKAPAEAEVEPAAPAEGAT